jgi:hypothetical protein
MDLLSLPTLREMDVITLEEMSDLRLMNRIDTKFIISEAMLPDLLESVKNEYRVQIVAGRPVSPYQTLYYDTADLRMYTVHHNGKRYRKKIRTRTYLDSDLSFLEVKKKDNKGRTNKRRISISPMVFDKLDVSKDAVGFLREQTPDFGIKDLMPQVYNRFDRITLVNNEKTERLTIDGNLRFKNYQTGISKELPGFMIVELKQDGMYPSVIKQYLLDHKVAAKGFSKYCLGTVVTNPNAKKNLFKSKLRFLEKIIKPFNNDTTPITPIL